MNIDDMKVGKKYKHSVGGSRIFTCTSVGIKGVIFTYEDYERDYEFYSQDLYRFVEFKEPVIEIMYGRAASPTATATYWSLSKFVHANLKATFTDGKLTAVEIIE